MAVGLDSSGQPQLCEQVCLLPLPIPKIICGCPGEAMVTTGRPVAVITMNGRFDFHLPRKVCTLCSVEWTPDVKELVAYNYWPSVSSSQTIYSFAVFDAFSEVKVSAPSFSRNAFIKLLQHQSAQGGRSGNISGDTFQKSYFEFCLCQHAEDKLTEEDNFNCPACQPDMLAVCCDGNRKHYRFKKNQGIDEPSIYDGLFLARDKEVSAFVDKIRGSSSRAHQNRTCGMARFRASRETSSKSSAKIDEEGLQVAVCRHGILLRGLNHYRGEIFAYPLYLQQEVAERANVTFFCMDVACRYWPYLNRVISKHPELRPLTEMKPFLSVMHAKVHRPKCEVTWGGRSQEGAGNTVGEEVEQVNSFLSRAAVVTKYMTKSGRENMLTQQAMGWNNRKKKHLHKALAHRYTKISERAKTEADNHRDFCLKNGITKEKAHQCVHDVLQWAAEEVESMEEANEELMEDIETALVDLLRKKQDLYRQHDSSKTREKKRRKLRTLKEKLKQKVEEYNETAEETIDIELACNLNEHYILPWERGRDVNTRLKRSVFDQTMLVRRLEEEQSILVKEMTQHITSLRKEMKRVEKLADSPTFADSEDLSVDASDGLKTVCIRRVFTLTNNIKEAVATYTAVVENLPLTEEDNEDEEDEFSCSDSPYSESDED
ncbi:uncharacterized protein LOC134444427 [Engraulis encrasicolus]|uniref:uncharacterized protein LOC134444427 n=1 Tax=Engraulis encrasicolus TaxID=184585 RepID=UPI002FCFABAE